jgi:hypothetical protein
MNSDRREDGKPKEVPVTLHGRGGARGSTAVAHWISHATNYHGRFVMTAGRARNGARLATSCALVEGQGEFQQIPVQHTKST